MDRKLLVGCATFLLIATPSCKKLSTGAREQFAKEFSCPEERVQVKERPDVQAYDLIWGPKTPQTPPEEVRNDPGRLAKWKADHDGADAKARESWNASENVFEANGCDHSAFLTCHHPGGSKGTRMDEVSCRVHELDEDGNVLGDLDKWKKKAKKSK
jgi:hypothetical protein